MSERLVRSAANRLARSSSRRGFLVKVAVVASAVTVGPLRYLLHPLSAQAVIRCRDCGPNAGCCDGWTTFCCTISGQNTCPPNSFIGGWWKCTDYRGGGLCDAEGVRYYMDCNLHVGSSCAHGCSCAGGSCDGRSTCCTVFRYGQCNTQVAKVTAIVCRVITCVNPCRLYPNQCSCGELVDNATCSHHAPCLGAGAGAQPSPVYHGLNTGGGKL